MLTIVEQPETKKLYAVSDSGCYAFDGTPVKLDTTGWRVITANVPTVADWQREPGNYRTYYGAVTVAVIENDGHKATFKMGDNISYLVNWLQDAKHSLAYEAVSYQWIAAYSDRNAARAQAETKLDSATALPAWVDQKGSIEDWL